MAASRSAANCTPSRASTLEAATSTRASASSKPIPRRTIQRTFASERSACHMRAVLDLNESRIVRRHQRQRTETPRERSAPDAADAEQHDRLEPVEHWTIRSERGLDEPQHLDYVHAE